MDHAESKVAGVVERNIAALLEHRRKEESARTLHGRVADAVTRLAGNVTFVYVNLVLVAFWFAINRGWTPIQPFDESFHLLGTVTAVEALFLSTFVLITQNRMDRLAEKRSELALQISLLSEHEVTQLVRLVARIGEKLGVQAGAQLDEIKRDVPPEAVLERMEQRNARYDHTKS